jgi:hypothetical protein
MNLTFVSCSRFGRAPALSALAVALVVSCAHTAAAQSDAYLDIDAPSAVMVRAAAAVAADAVAVDAGDGVPPATRSELHEQKVASEAQRNTDCETGVLRGKPCRVSWIRVLGESVEMLAAQHGGNILLDKDTRTALTTGDFWGRYIQCVDNYRWSRWKDDDPFGVDYIGHPMMGGLTSAIYEQNDPKQRALSYENSRRYWMGRLRAMAYSAAYSAQWKVGPVSEASIGNTGIGYYVRQRDGVYTNETGMQDFFVTPIGGLAWNVGEDAIDRLIVSHVRHAHPRNKAILIVASFMTPTRSAANLLRFRAVYYRDLDMQTAQLPTR